MKLQGRNLESGMRGDDVRLLQDELRQLGFRISENSRQFDSDTFIAVEAFQQRHNLPTTGIVDPRTARAINKAVDQLNQEEYIVKGEVLEPDGEPLTERRILLFEKRLRVERRLGSGSTDAEGRYEIRYPVPETERFSIFVRALDPQGNEAAVSPVICPVQPVETVDLVVGDEPFRGRSEFRGLRNRLAVILRIENLRPDELTADDIHLLACQHELSEPQLYAFAASSRLQLETGFHPEVFYALIRQNLPERLEALLMQDKDVLRSAIEGALEENIVSPRVLDRIAPFFERLDVLRVRKAIGRSDEEGKFSLGDLFGTARIDREQQEVLLERFLNREGSVRDFWTSLESLPSFGPERVLRAQFAVQLGTVTNNHIPLIAELQREGITTTRELASISEAGWLERIQRDAGGGRPIGTPPGIQGEDEAERQQNYARVMAAMVEDAFPTAVIEARLGEEGDDIVDGQGELLGFLRRNPDFDFGRHRIDAYLREHAEASEGSEADDPRLRQNLKTIRRLFPLTPRFQRYEALKPLLRSRLTSAAAIARRGSAVVSLLRDDIGETGARAVLDNALQRSAMAQAIFAEFSPAMHRVVPRAIFPGTALPSAGTTAGGLGPWWEALPPDEERPDLETLFGNIDFCHCEHCQSVYSPAAYLTDILAFVIDQGLRNQLLTESRRADIGRIELGCQNTNTPLPYIDLVIERLEDAVAGVSLARQTTWTAAELRAQPEHRNAAAYDRLAAAVFPWRLPFSLFHEEAWRYLNQLKVSRYQLMETFGSGNTPDSIQIAADHLGLTPMDGAIITGSAALPLWEAWGMPGLAPDPPDGDAEAAVDELRQALRSVPTFLNQTNLSYDELLERLSLTYVNPQGNQRVEFEEDSPCDPDAAFFLQPLTTSFLDRFHRFERLRRKLRWSCYDLDRAVASLTTDGELSEALLVRLSDAEAIRDRFKLPLVDLLAWWSPIDTRSYRPLGSEPNLSLYERRFLNRAVFDPEILAAFHLNQLGNPDQVLADFLPHIAAGLSASTADLSEMIDETSTMSLATFSHLFRHLSLARALKSPARDLSDFIDLSGLDPFADPRETLDFVKIFDSFHASGFTIPQLLFLLGHSVRPGGPDLLPTSAIGQVLDAIREGLRQIHEETTLPPELTEPQPSPNETTAETPGTPGPIAAVTVSRLGRLMPEGSLDLALALIRGEAIEAPEAFISEHLPFLDIDDALQTLVGQNGEAPQLSSITQLAARFQYVLEALLPHLRRTLGEAFVVQTLAAELELSVAMTEFLIIEVLSSTVDESGTVIDDFLIEAFVESDDDLTGPGGDAGAAPAETFSRQFEAFTKIWKTALVINTLAIDEMTLGWIHANGPTIGLLDLEALPVQSPENAVPPELFSQIQHLIEFILIRDGLPAASSTLFRLLDIALEFDPQTDDAQETATEWIQHLHLATGWDVDDLTHLALTPNALDLAFPEDFRNGHAVRRLMECVKVLKQLGVSASALVSPSPEMEEWISPEIGPGAVQRIKSAVKAKFENAQWLEIAGSINDNLREVQRDALLDLVIATDSNGLDDVNAVYGHYLMDPEMSACMMTSRIKQAISSVQLFIQRVQLNLEDASLTSEAIEAWKWMRNYRVWEANRKVFLYPENWIEPELRDDKSPFFEALESELLQNDITDETVETALRHYLEKLSEVAHLEIAGVFTEADKNLHHIFARTPSAPHIYFYRKWHYPKRWTPWETVDLNIEGNHLIPVVLNEQLMLFWPLFEEKPLESETTGEDSESQETYWEIRLAWSEYAGGGWSPTKESQERLTLPHTVNTLSSAVIEKTSFRTTMTSNGLLISMFWGHHPQSRLTGHLEYLPSTRHIRAIPISSKDDSRIDFLTRPLIRFFEPSSTSPQSMKFIEKQGSHSLEIFTAEKNDQGSRIKILTLPKTPGRFRIAYPHQHFLFLAQSLFFYEDRTKTFAVHPFDVSTQIDDPVGGSVGSNFTAGIRSTHDANPVEPGVIFHAFDRLLNLIPSEFSSLDAHALTDVDDFQPLLPVDDPELDLNAIVGMPALLAFNASYTKKFRFHCLYHPYVHEFRAALNLNGVDGLLGRLDLQQLNAGADFFENRYGDTTLPDPLPPSVLPSYPLQGVAFTHAEAHALYNWELFFHIPLLIADRLSQDQRFEEAVKWFYKIFNPTDCSTGGSPQCYWRFLPFFQYDLANLNSLPVQQLLTLLSQGSPVFRHQVDAWRENPFMPHAIARLRPIAYQKTVVMKYLDCLISWADQLFLRDTIESINEATQLYVLAAEILGPRPTEVPREDHPPIQTFDALEPRLDEFSNALVEIEEHIADEGMHTIGGLTIGGGGTTTAGPPPSVSLYFCLPKNEKLLNYWDTVADRLFKIRHCMNIKGIVRELPLFEPPIDPALLVRAVAAGLDLGSVIQHLDAPPPHYRFQIMAEKASQMIEEVKRLGGAMLGALEKKDAEMLARLRSGQEADLIEAMAQVRGLQLDEAKEVKLSLERAFDLADARFLHYQNLLSDNTDLTADQKDAKGAFQQPVQDLLGDLSDLHLNQNESESLFNLAYADFFREKVYPWEKRSGNQYLLPNVSVGISVSVPGGVGTSTSVSYGGSNIGPHTATWAALYRDLAEQWTFIANTQATKAGYQRRAEEWTLQFNLARLEKLQIEKQQAAADLRIAIAEAEIANQALQLKQAEENKAFLQDKFTNQELYGWMVGQLAGVYFQSYRLAYDLALRTQRAFAHELGIDNPDFIGFGHWDNLKKGLLAGEKLHHDLKRMEAAYLEENRREFELTKHVSLAVLDPLALLHLKEEGRCEIELPEALFDLDYPGHYFRRIKSVRITIPAVAGPYTTLACTLRLLRSSIRRNASPVMPYARNLEGEDARFSDSFGAIQSIATSSGQNDAGLFELNFRDERYLPFEGAGVISRWQLEMPDRFRQFDYDAISDVILHISYTARDGGSVLRQEAEDHLTEAVNALVTGDGAPGLMQSVSARHHFPTVFHRFLHPEDDAEAQTMTLNIGSDRFPYMFKGRDIQVDRIHVLLRLSDTLEDISVDGTVLALFHPGGETSISFDGASTIGNIHHVDTGPVTSGPGEWRVTLSSVGDDVSDENNRLNPEAVEDLIFILHYMVA